MILMGWLLYTAKICLRDPKQEWHVAILERIRDGSEAAILYFKIIYKSGLWLDRDTASELLCCGREVLLSYEWMARKCLELRIPGYMMVPKLHAWDHDMRSLKAQLDDPSCDAILSPGMYLCEADEDYIGQVSRISRRVSARTVCLRTLERYLVCKRLAIKQSLSM